MFIGPREEPGTPDGGGSRSAAVDHLGEIGRLESEIARLQGRQMVHMAAHVAAVEASDRALLAKNPRASAFAEINLMLNASGRYADNWIGEACELAALLPRTLAEVCAGRLTRYRAMVILNQLSGLSGEELAGAEDDVLTVAAGLTPAKLREKAQRTVARINPEAVIKRRKVEHKRRFVAVQPAADGMAYLSAYLAAEDAHAIFGIVDTAARTAKAPGDERTIDERRADALRDLICHPESGEKRIRWQGQLLVPLGTALGLNGEPGYLPGHGPIPAEVCRELAADATWRRILTDPVTNTTLDVAPNRYRPGAQLSRLIHFRDKTCRWPGCNRTKVDTDHTIRREHGGLTVRVNLGDFCEHHHDLKDSPGWKVVQDDDGIFTIITPSGRVYRSRPPGADGEVKPVEEIPIPKPEGRAAPPPSDDSPPF
jgi:Domain of unknown function (DUF222)